MHYCIEPNTRYIGIGGWKCPCCAPGRLHRKRVRRMIKRSERANLRKEINGLVA